jgi:hypothetical protein
MLPLLRWSNTLAIERLCDGLAALARDVAREDAPDDFGLIRVDRQPVSVGHGITPAVPLPAGVVRFCCVPVHDSAGPETPFELSLKTPASVVTELLQIFLTEHAYDLCADVKNFEPVIHGVGSSSRNPQLVPDPPKIFAVSTEAGEVVAEDEPDPDPLVGPARCSSS